MLSFIAPAYQYIPILPYALSNQTCPDWELILLHDTYNEKYAKLVEDLNDPRIRLYFSREQKGRWGHPLRKIGLTQLSSYSTFVCHTNCDNYYTPNFVEEMQSVIEGDVIGSYCDCIHSHFAWQTLFTRLRHGEIDCGAVIVRTPIAIEVGWKSIEFSADWEMLQEIVGQYGEERFIKVHKSLFVHN